MTALLIIGIALAGFGALVLLKFPDRPGGTIRLHGMEVSSTGAGLPLIVLGIVAIVLSTLGGTTPEERPLQPPAAVRGSPRAPAVVGNLVGRLIDPVTQELASSGAAVTEVPVVDASKREGEIVAQDPAPGQPLASQVTLTVVRNPGTIDLLSCCVRFLGVCGSFWAQRPAVLARQRYDTALRNDTICVGGEYNIAIVLSADRRITRLTGVVGIPNDSDASSDEAVTVIVLVDGTEQKRETITVVNPLLLDLKVGDAARVELVFADAHYAPVAIADLTGYQSSP